MFFHEVTGGVIGCQPFRLHGGGVVVVAAVKKRFAIRGIRVAGAVHLRVPVITGEQFVGTLAALDNLAMLGHFPRQQIERDAVVADHRFAHGAERSR
ncbi:hypothetical protein D3C84_803340 [compost metagenome]